MIIKKNQEIILFFQPQKTANWQVQTHNNDRDNFSDSCVPYYEIVVK